MKFINRAQAARELAKALNKYSKTQAVVYALPRGGVVLGKIVGQYLNAPLDLLIPRKIGHPSMHEYAIAAVTESGALIENKTDVESIDAAWFNQEVENQRKEARRRRETYLQNRKPVDVAGKIAIIVDDGIATGLTMKAAIADLKGRKPASIVVAVPVAPRDTVQELETLVEKIIVLETPVLFMGSIGAYYESFDQVSDKEVIGLMSE